MSVVKKGLPVPPPEQHDTTIGEIFVRRSASKQLTDLRHDESGERAGRRAAPLERGLERKAVHHGGEHAHGVAGRPRHAARRGLHASHHIAPTDHDGDLGSELAGCNQIAGDPVNGRLVDAEGLASGEIFSG